MKLICIFFTLIFVICMTNLALALPNPSAVYCEKLGYEYKIVKNPDGSERGVCVVGPGVEFDAWAFFMGEVGKEYSYCAKYGYDTETEIINKGTYSIKCAVCVPKRTFLDKVKSLFGVSVEQKRVPMLELMEQNGEPLIDIKRYQIPQESGEEKAVPQKLATIEKESSQQQLSEAGALGVLPSSFDWRNYNGEDWITPVKCQFGGTCWAFSAVGAVEAKVNIDANDPDLDYDLSEQQLVSCGGGGTCDGGQPNDALTYIRNTGITTNDCFPYISCNAPCSNRCANWQEEAVKIIDWHRVLASPVDTFVTRRQAYKQALMDYGPLSVVMGTGDMYYVYDGEEYYCSVNGWHAVVLVGWDDSENAWIIKNSWGLGWGNNGYAKMHYNYFSYGYAIDQTILPHSLYFSSPIYNVYEDGGSVTITVSRASGTHGTVSVDYTTSNGTAIAGEDYTATSGTLTFGDGEISKNFTVPIINDTKNEGNETVNLTLSNLVGDAVLGTLATAIITIVDDETNFVDSKITLPGVTNGSLAWGDYDNDGDLDMVLCGESSSGSRITKIYRNNSNNTFTDIGAGLHGVGDGFLAWGDYDNDGDLDLVLGGRSASGPTSRIYRNNGNNTFTNIGGAGLPGLRDVHDRSAAWGDYDNDGDLDLAVCAFVYPNDITRIYKNNGDNTLTDIGAGLPGAEEGSLEWGDYDNDGDLDLAVCGSQSGIYKNNGDDTFTDIKAGIASTGIGSGSLAWGDYDNDGDLDLAACGGTYFPYFTRIYKNNGDDTFTDIKAGLTGVTNGSLAWGDYDNDGDLDLAVCGGPWAAGADGPIITKIYRNDGDDAFTDIEAWIAGVYYSSLAWGDYDNDGDLDLAICGNSGTGYVTKIYKNFEANFNDNTSPSAPTNLTFEEGSAILKWNSGFDTETPDTGLYYNIRVGTTSRANDIVSSVYGSPLLGNYLRPKLTSDQLGIRLDNLRAGTHYWSVQTIDTGLEVSEWSNEETFVVTCGAKLQFSSPTYTVNENGGSITITVNRTEKTGGIVTVDYSTSNGSAVAGEDYATTSGTLTFGDGETKKTFTIPIIDDTEIEENETVNLTLGNPTGEGAVLGSPTTAALTIIDNEPGGILQFSLSTYAVNENAGSVTITVNRIERTSGTVTVDYATSDGTAIAGQDYTVTSGTLTFAEGETSKTFSIPIIDDQNYEENETVSLILTNPSSGAVLGSFATAILTILDNDGGKLQFSSSTYTVNENGGSATITVNRTEKTVGAITVDYATIDGTAKAGEDYTATSGTLTFGNGETSKTFTVPIIDDQNYEGNETVNLTLSNPVGATLVSPSTAVLTIVSNDCQIYFSSSNYKVNENEVSATISVNYTGGDCGSGEVTVNYSTSNGTAKAGEDYTATSGTLTFTAGEPSIQTFTVPIIDDEKLEGPDGETVNIMLNKQSYYGPTSAILTIIDDESKFVNSGIDLTGDGSLAWGDYDNDGDLDLAVCGNKTGSEYITRIYKNNGDTFTDIGADLTGVDGILYRGSLAWGDYDNNGDLDLAICGRSETEGVITKIYRNNGNDTFTDIEAGLTGVLDSSLAWGDYDNDGDLDLAICGYRYSEGEITKIYKNNGDDTFTDIEAGLAGAAVGSLAWGDYDNDGDLDLAVCGINSSGDITNIYRNNGDDTFTDIEAGLPGGEYGSLAWGDYDNDGDLDLAVCGEDITSIYKNNGDDTFTDIEAGIAGGAYDYSSVAWGDYDNDGDLDLAVCGEDITSIYRNNGDDTFTDIEAGLAGAIHSSSVAWGDYNNDGNLDLAICGDIGSGRYITRIYIRNPASEPDIIANTPPSAPTNLTYEKESEDTTVLKWDSGFDSETPENGLYYNLRVGTSPGANDIVSGVYGSPLLGNYLRPKLSSDQLGVRLKELPVGTYYWSVQTIDTSLKASQWGDEKRFVVGFPSYTISGKITLGGGSSVLTNVVLSLSGTVTDTTHPATDGSYSFTKLEEDIYTVTPSLENYHFFPASRSYPFLDGDQLNQDFIGLHKDYDSDLDTLPDWWELENFGNLGQGADDDYDSDGLTDLQECQKGTNPINSDTDEDGIPDGWEVQYGLNPLDWSDASQDTDHDGWTNLQEYRFGSDPNNACPAQPVGSSPKGDNISLTPPLSASDYSDTESDPHLCTEWQIAYDIDFTNLVFEDTIPITKINKETEPIALAILKPDKTYYWRVRYADLGGWSQWSVPVEFKTSTLNDFLNKNEGIDTTDAITSDIKTVVQAAYRQSPENFSNLPSGYQFYNDIFSFRIDNITPGDTVEVTFHLDEPFQQDDKWFKYYPDLGWDDTYADGENYISGRGTNVITLKFTDGGAGDIDGIANGVIVDPSGPGRVSGGGNDNGGGGGGGGGGCFIATACYGTPMVEEVVILRQFRDECLLTNPVGKVFVKTYYKVSPSIAEFIREHPVLKSVVRGILKPLIWINRKMS